MNNYFYTFPAIKGIQANSEYYICMIPLKLLLKIFPIDSDIVEPEFRAQRKINFSRIPEIKNYILDNRNSYVFSALCASFDGEHKFKSMSESQNIGTLCVSLDSTFLINDGQHRRAAISEALLEDKTLENETIPVVMFLDKGLSRSQQMFTDLNKHAVNTTKSLNALYDSSDPMSVISKKVVSDVPFLKKYTDKEKDNLGKFSSHLFTLNNIVNANKYILKGVQIDNKTEEILTKFWNLVCANIAEFTELENRILSKAELREEFIVTQGVTISAFGLLGNFLIKNKGCDFSSLENLKNIDWRRSNTNDWVGKALKRNGRIIKNNASIFMTYVQIKKLIGLEITSEDRLQIKKYR